MRAATSFVAIPFFIYSSFRGHHNYAIYMYCDKHYLGNNVILNYLYYYSEECYPYVVIM